MSQRRMSRGLPKDTKEVSLTIDGKALKFTNLNKVWFPKDGYTKRDVLNYYDAVADLIVPHLAGPAAVVEAVSERHP